MRGEWSEVSRLGRGRSSDPSTGCYVDVKPTNTRVLVFSSRDTRCLPWRSGAVFPRSESGARRARGAPEGVAQARLAGGAWTKPPRPVDPKLLPLEVGVPPTRSGRTVSCAYASGRPTQERLAAMRGTAPGRHTDSECAPLSGTLPRALCLRGRTLRRRSPLPVLPVVEAFPGAPSPLGSQAPKKAWLAPHTVAVASRPPQSGW